MAGSTNEQRRYERHEIRLPVQVLRKQGNLDLLTLNVSRHGAFLLSDDPPAERQLTNLSFHLPDGEVVKVMGTVARTVGPEEDLPPGAGIDFFSLSNEAKEIWDRFCVGLEKGEPVAAPAGDDPLPDAPIHRKSPRKAVSFLVRLKDRERMMDFYTKDISSGGMFLKTPLLKDVDTELVIVLIHPETHEEFNLESRVVRVVPGPKREEKGMGIEFTGLSGEMEVQLKDFIETGSRFLNPELFEEESMATA